MGADAMIFVFGMLNFRPTFSLSSFTFNKRPFSSSLFSAVKVVSFAYLSWNLTSSGTCFLIIHVRSYFSVTVVVHQHTYFSLQMCVWIGIWVASRMGFLGTSDSKESACNAGDLSSIPGQEAPLENGYPLQYSCLENSVDKRNRVGYSPWGRKE